MALLIWLEPEYRPWILAYEIHMGVDVNDCRGTAEVVVESFMNAVHLP